jgi:hypothetical protein
VLNRNKQNNRFITEDFSLYKKDRHKYPEYQFQRSLYLILLSCRWPHKVQPSKNQYLPHLFQKLIVLLHSEEKSGQNSQFILKAFETGWTFVIMILQKQKPLGMISGDRHSAH